MTQDFRKFRFILTPGSRTTARVREHQGWLRALQHELGDPYAIDAALMERGAQTSPLETLFVETGYNGTVQRYACATSKAASMIAADRNKPTKLDCCYILRMLRTAHEAVEGDTRRKNNADFKTVQTQKLHSTRPR